MIANENLVDNTSGIQSHFANMERCDKPHHEQQSPHRAQDMTSALSEYPVILSCWSRGQFRWLRSARRGSALTDSALWVVAMVVVLTLLGGVAEAGGPPVEDLRYRLPEEGQAGDFVGNIYEDLALAAQFNGSADARDELRFRILKSQYDGFVIHNRTGVIRTSGPIDRESLCRASAVCDIEVDVVIQPIPYFRIVKVIVEITDLNDYSPQFSEASVTHAVRETSLPELNLVSLYVLDPDSPQNSIQRVDLLPSSLTKFGLKQVPQIDGSTEVRLILKESLDHEEQDSYNLRIIAYDGGNPVRTGSVDIAITVVDSNDNRPTFTSPTYEVTVPEDVALMSTLTRVLAVDPDSGLYGEISYGFTSNTQRVYGDLFEIASDTGDVIVKGHLDYESVPVYHLGVTAVDGGPDGLSGDAIVVVSVTDVNDHAPEIVISTLSSAGDGAGGGSPAVVEENSPAEAFVADVTVTDPDSGRSGEMVCSLNDTRNFQLRYMYDYVYQVLTRRSFDREERALYTIAVSCTDLGPERLLVTKLLQVAVTDANDHAPVFTESTYSAELHENNFEGVSVARVVATDQDAGRNAQVEYSLVDPMARRLFAVDTDTGVITAVRSLDREQQDQFQFLVYATDKGVPAMTSSVLVAVLVQDVNDEHPRFSHEIYSFGVFENETPGSEVGIVSAEDRDAPPNNRFRFRFVSPVGELSPETAFRIHPDTGRITTVASLDRERHSKYELLVEAAEYRDPESGVASGNTGATSSTATVFISVADQNDNPPVLVFPNSTNHTVVLASNARHGFTLARARALDADIGKNGRVTYAIVSGNEAGYFDIEADRGTVIVDKVLGDYQSEAGEEAAEGDIVATFHLNITATDGEAPYYTTSGVLHILVNKTAALVTSHSGLGANTNMVVVIALAVASGIITVVLVLAIVFIRRQDRQGHRNNGKYNCRVETLKFLNVKRGGRKLVSGSTTSSGSGHSTEGSTGGGDAAGKPRKEVSFSVEVEGRAADLSGDKSQRSWPSVIDHQTLQAPRACSSMLTGLTTPPVAASNGSYSLSNGVLPGNNTNAGHHGVCCPMTMTRRELEVQQLMELLKRDQDASSLHSGEGSNTDSGRGASEEGGDPAGGVTAGIHPDTAPYHNNSQRWDRLSTVPEDSFTSNQVVPSCYDHSLVSLASSHNTTLGSYRPPDRPPSQSSQNRRGYYDTYRNPGPHRVPRTDSRDSLRLHGNDSTVLAGTVCDADSIAMEKEEAAASHQSKVGSRSRLSPIAASGSHGNNKGYPSNAEVSELDSEYTTDTGMGYSCIDVSEALQSRVSRGVDADADDDSASTTTSGSYVVDPQELCQEIDDLFFKDAAFKTAVC